MRLVEFVLGVGPESERASEWLDSHPAASLAIFLALAALSMVRW